MFLASVNKSQQLLLLSFIEQVQVAELERGTKELAAHLAELEPGFRMLTDLGRLESIEPDCAAEIGKVMELCDQKGVELVVRVIPDQTKDIGLNILAFFHYHHRPRTVTCESMVEAAKLLRL